MQYLIKVVSELSVEELIALKVNVVHTIRPAATFYQLSWRTKCFHTESHAQTPFRKGSGH